MSARLSRLRLTVQDLGRATRFYTQVLGLRVAGESPGAVFLSSGPSAHEIALHEAPGSDAVKTLSRGVSAVGFEVEGRRELAAVCNRLVRSGAPVTAMDHGISLSLYTSDPDGNPLEVYCDTRSAPSGPAVWTGEARVLSLADISSESLADAAVPV